MNSSIFEIFKIGIGPSSSHTVGPMIIANRFVQLLEEKDLLDKVQRIKIVLYGSLSATGSGHNTPKAVLLGLSGDTALNIDTLSMSKRMKSIIKDEKILLNTKLIDFVYASDLVFSNEFLDFHPNAISLFVYDYTKELICEQTYYSIGGGYVLNQDEINEKKKENIKLPFSFSNGKELIFLCKKHKLKISELIFQNELAYRSKKEINTKLEQIWKTMQESVQNGCKSKGLLPGSLKVPKRANKLYEKLSNKNDFSNDDPLEVLDWVDLYALAVNEENASGNRVVTAPTNGAAGVIPAVLHYINRFINKDLDNFNQEQVNSFLLTAGAIGILYQKNASISGADVGCQGEVGVACSMAAAALAEIMGADVDKIENAAEIAMEHNLGLTCDPIGGYVQIPCIERNAMASTKAINAARMAINGTGKHCVSLDSVIKTMFITGKDMQNKYKETSKGGLAVNAIEC